MIQNNILFRKAQANDVTKLVQLIAISSRALASQDYTKSQIDAAIGTVWGVDEELIQDQTYFIAESKKGELAGCGGWSKRDKLFGASEGDEASPLLIQKQILHVFVPSLCTLTLNV